MGKYFASFLMVGILLGSNAALCPGALILDVNLSGTSPFYTTAAYNGATGTVTLTGSKSPVAGSTSPSNTDNSWENNGATEGYNATNIFFSEIGDGTGGDETAIWQFTGLTPGVYSVHVTYVPLANRTTAAPYEIFNGTTAGPQIGSTIFIDQEAAPNDLTINDGQGLHSWEQLSAGATITGSVLSVRLSDVANSGNNNFVIADAVRIEFLSPLVPEPAGLLLGAAGLLGLLVYFRRRRQ